MEVDTDDDANFDVVVSVTSGNNNLIEPITFGVNNSFGYSATAGAVLYINPKTRSNSQSNSRSIVNEADKSVIPALRPEYRKNTIRYNNRALLKSILVFL